MTGERANHVRLGKGRFLPLQWVFADKMQAGDPRLLHDVIRSLVGGLRVGVRTDPEYSKVYAAHSRCVEWWDCNASGVPGSV
jgi:hypothetical protein